MKNEGQNICLVLKITREGKSLRSITKFVTFRFCTPGMRTTMNSASQLDPALLANVLAPSPAEYLVLLEDALS